MKTIKSVLLLSVLLAAVAGSTAWAAPGGFHGGAGFHGGGSHFHGGGHFRGRVGVVIGGPLYWPYYSYPYYPYYPGPYYSPPIVVTPAPQTYIEQESDAADADQYWYFCTDPKGYYPYVQTCPSGWRQVTPQPPADGN